MTDPIIYKSRTEQRVEAETGEEITALLRRLYHGEGKSQDAIASQLGVSRGTVVDWMIRWDIPTRPPRQSHRVRVA